jgi:CheY-like chemotaxis protein
MKRTKTARSKVLFADSLAGLFLEKSSFFYRTDIILFTADSADDVLKLHREEKLDLIVIELGMPGMDMEKMFAKIRTDDRLRDVSVIMICRDDPEQRERCRRCSANSVFTLPVDVGLFEEKAQELLQIAPRKAYRAIMAVGIQGRFRDKPQPFWTVNISASGMLVRSEEPLGKGDTIFFSFFLPKGAHAGGYGVITRVIQVARVPATYHYGVRFTDLDAETRAAIAAASRRGLQKREGP